MIKKYSLYKYLNIQNLFNLLLLIWCIFIPFKDAIYQISTALIILFFITYVLINKDYKYLKNIILRFKELVIAFSLVILSMTISNIINDVSNTDAWRIELMFILRYALIFVILIYFYSKNFFSKNNLIIFIVISLTTQCFDGVYQAVMGYDLFKNNIGSLELGLSAATSNRNTYGFLMGLGVFITFIYILKRSKINLNSFLIFICFIMFSFTTLFSYSRAVWISLVLCICLYLLSQFKHIKFTNIVYVILFFSVISYLLINVDSLSNRLTALISFNTSGRDIIWLKAIDLIKERPLLGWGLDTWKINGALNYAGIHNSILEIIFFTGFFGLIAFFSLFYIILKSVFLNKQWELLFIVLFLFITSQFGNSVFKSKIFLSVITIVVFYIYSNRFENKSINL